MFSYPCALRTQRGRSHRCGRSALREQQIGLVQTDIKHVPSLLNHLATRLHVSLVAASLPTSASIFHLVTPRFSRRCCSSRGRLGDSRDGRRTGPAQDGRPHPELPVTFWTMTAAVFTIAGFFPFAELCYRRTRSSTRRFCRGPRQALWFVGLVQALAHIRSTCSGSGTWRSSVSRASPEIHPHESPWSMLGPLVILALLSIGGGWVGIERFAAFLSPTTGPRIAESATPISNCI